jgi:hypothetical protein
VISGDHERTALDFQKHYRQSSVYLMDTVDADLKLGKPFHASGRSIDMVPVMAVQGQAAWCAWDSLILAGDSASKSLQVRRVGATGCEAAAVSVATNLEHICSPCFAQSPQGRMALVWCQKKRGGSWELRRSDCDDQGQWSMSQALVTTGNPRYGSATFDTQGHLWLSYTADTENGRQIKVQQP